MALKPLLLKNPVQHYDWGHHEAIPKLMGCAPDGEPYAELWMGAHAKAPSHAWTQEGAIALDTLIASDPAAYLGRKGSMLNGGRLPFLVKVLAASRSLSIQCHPNAIQAHTGFARENARGLALDDPQRNYRDDNHKPELLVALEPFTALYGLRSAAEIQENFARLQLSDAVAGLSALDEQGDQGLSLFFKELLAMRGQAEGLLQQAVKYADITHPADGWIPRLVQQHPQDPGALAPLFMHVVTLQPLEGLYLGAGQLHAYLEGVGVEVMAASDNVLRAGLTSKHINIDELMQVAVFEPTLPNPIRAEKNRWGMTWGTPAEEFQVSRLDVGGRMTGREGDGQVAILLVSEGRVEIVGTDYRMALEQGQASLVPAAAGSYALEGVGVVWQITVR